jgi:hypothetical protein
MNTVAFYNTALHMDILIKHCVSNLQFILFFLTD